MGVWDSGGGFGAGGGLEKRVIGDCPLLHVFCVWLLGIGVIGLIGRNELSEAYGIRGLDCLLFCFQHFTDGVLVMSGFCVYLRVVVTDC